MAFIDEAKFFVKAGDGGNGCVSFRREKFVPKGGPDGGDGGTGGDVIIEAAGRLSSLLDFKYRSHFIAEKGRGGQGKKMHGRGGEDCLVLVPAGSVIREVESGDVLADLVRDGQRWLAAKGGDGGRGNVHFASSVNRAPRTATKGTPGEERWLKIELKLLADVGLVGLPNAGKSTLLSRLSAANPKVADYPFTTLSPQLGVLTFADRSPCIIADIPGLIEGAHQGAGLGHKFLKHIERTRILLQVIGATGLPEEPMAQYRLLEAELGRYQQELLDRRRLVVLNKIDLLAEEAGQLEAVLAEFAAAGITVLPISALTGEGIAELKELIADGLEAATEAEAAATRQATSPEAETEVEEKES